MISVVRETQSRMQPNQEKPTKYAALVNVKGSEDYIKDKQKLKEAIMNTEV